MLERFASDRFINAFKTTLACLIGLVCLHYFNFASGQWLIITILVVMSAQMHVGGALQKGYLRFIGTLLGAGIAALALWLGAGNKIVIDAVVLFSALFFSYISGISQAWGQAGTLGAVTVAILLLSPNNDWHNALWRTGEILFGIVLALGVSIFIWPIRATVKWRLQLAKNLRELSHYYGVILTGTHDQANEVEEKIMQLFLQSKKLQDEAMNEPQLTKENKQRFQELLHHQKRLFRAFSLLDSYLIKHAKMREQFLKSKATIETSLQILVNAIEQPALKISELPDLSVFIATIPEQHFLHFLLTFVSQEIPLLASVIEKIK